MHQPFLQAETARPTSFTSIRRSGTASYSPTFLLYESKLFERAEADELFKKMTATLVAEGSITMMPLNYAK